MMTRQARAMYPDAMPLPTHFRPYPSNSLQARARVVVIALLVDGETDDHELAFLNDPAWLEGLDIDRPVFIQVLNEFCEDLAKITPSGIGYPLRDDELLAMLNEVNHAALQSRLKQVTRHLIECDGKVSRQEAQLWRKMLSSWRLTD